jgi:hypothetical protein
MRIHYKGGSVSANTTMGIDSIKISPVLVSPPYNILIYDDILSPYEVTTADVDSITFYKINFIADDLLGEWINEQQDTLDFTWSYRDISGMFYYKPLSGKSRTHPFFIEGDSILVEFVCSPVEPGDECELEMHRKYYFRYLETEIEIHDYKEIERNIFKRLEE